MSKYCQLHLTCANKEEADKIANALLVKHLIVCAKQIPISSDFRWQGKIEHSKEVMLIMDTKTQLFEAIEAEVKKLHSYDVFVLQSLEIDKLNKQAENWMEAELHE